MGSDGIGSAYKGGYNRIVGYTWPPGGHASLEFTSSCITPTYYVAAQPPQKECLSGTCSQPGVPQAGNPINPATGNKYQSEQDYAGGSLKFRRMYNSYDTDDGVLGKHWKHNYDKTLAVAYNRPAYLTGSPANSTPYTTPRGACEDGWLEVRGSVPGLIAATAQYNAGTGACDLKIGGNSAGTVALFNSGTAQSAVGFDAARGSGQVLRFTLSGSDYIASTDVTARLTAITGGYELRDGNTVETYDSNGRLQSIKGIGDELQTLSYDGNGRLQTVTDQHGRELNFTYDGNGRLQTVTDPDSETFSFTYDGNDMLETVTDADSKVRTYHYEEAGQIGALTGITDENSDRYATWDYDSNGRAILSKHAGNADSTSVAYSGSSTTVTGPLGAASVISLASVNGKQKMSGQNAPCAPSCGIDAAAITYDGNGFIASRTDFNGNLTTYVHDSRGLETSRTEADGTAQERTITTTWHSTFRLPTEIAEPGRTTTFTYDSDGNRLTQTVTDTATSASRTTTYTYTSKRLTSVNGPRTDVSDVTTFAYDGNGDLQTVTNALGHVTEILTRDAHGNPLTIEDPNGVVTTLAYDARQRLTSRSAGGLTTSYDYDDAGQLIQITLPDSSFIEYSYDAAHRLTDIEDNLGNRIHYSLDLAGNRTQEDVYDPNDVLTRTRSQVFNSLSRLTESIGGDSESTTYTYDDNGNLETVTDPLSHVTSNAYDALDRLTQVTDPGSGVTEYAYNGRDELTGVEDPRNLDTSYTLNGFGETETLTSPDTGTTESSYDAAGNLVSREDAKGQVTTYEYDALNRLIQITRDDSSTVIYSYDQGTYGKGRLTGISDPSGGVSWVYDALGRVTSRTESQGATDLVTTYGYNGSGQLISQTLPSGKVVGITWSGGKVSGLTLDSDPLLSNLTHQPFGPAKTWDFANSQSVTRTFDLDGRMTGHSLGALGYDADGRIDAITLGGLSILTGSKTYGYDAMDRLTSYSGANNLTYAYDANGNRTSQGDGVSTATFDIANGSNQIESVTEGSTANFTHDANGSITTDHNNSYAYDVSGRLASVNGYSYHYNGLNQRRAKINGGSTTLFSYDEQGHIIGEYDGAGLPVQETIWLGDTPVATVKGSDVYYIHSDHLNTPRQIDDANGDAVWAWETITFGSAGPNEDPGNTSNLFTYNLRFPGQYYDNESGLFQNWHRDYHPSTGRYMESDPIGLAGGVNTYSYSLASPTLFSDRYGLDAVAVAFPDYRISTPAGRIPWLGHAGVLLINQKGVTKYYEYGRYPDNNCDCGSVRTRRISNVVMGADGRPTPETLERVLREISNASGHGGRVSGAYIANQNFNAMKNHALERMRQNDDPNREPYDLSSNNCNTFMRDVIEAGGVDMPMMIDPRPNSYIEELRENFPHVDLNP